MREIEFRAYDGADWVYSSAVKYWKDDDQWLIYDSDLEEWMYCGEPQQYSGYKDKHDNKLYEGDVFFLGECLYLIVYDNGFKWKRIYDSWRKRNVFSENEKSWLCEVDCRLYINVVGNVQDTPKLLKYSYEMRHGDVSFL